MLTRTLPVSAAVTIFSFALLSSAVALVADGISVDSGYIGCKQHVTVRSHGNPLTVVRSDLFSGSVLALVLILAKLSRLHTAFLLTVSLAGRAHLNGASVGEKMSLSQYLALPQAGTAWSVFGVRVVPSLATKLLAAAVSLLAFVLHNGK